MICIKTVLIVGNEGAFFVELVNKFFKEGWRICLLSEKPIRSRLPNEVEKYRFGYASPSVQELIEGSKPEMVIFTGAYDTLYTWQEDALEAETSAYIAGLNNILMCASAAGVKQFVYLSSDAVFEDPSETDITEDAEPTPKSPRGLCVAQGETMATAFGRFSEIEVLVLRIGSMFCIPRSKEDCVDRYAEMCLSALLTGSVTVNAKRITAPLFVNDAVFGLYLIITAPQRRESIYHLAASGEASEEDIAQAMKRDFEKPITIVDRTAGVTDRRVLSGKRVAGEFQFTSRMEYDKAIAMIVSYMEEHRKNYGIVKKHSVRETLHRFRDALGDLFPFLECFIYFIPIFLLAGIHNDVELLTKVDFYLLFVFLFAMMRGRTMAIVAFCLSVFGYFFQEAQTMDMLELLISVNAYVWIVQLFVVGISTGFLRDKLMQTQLEKTESEQYLQRRLDEITAINASNAKIKNYYAEHIVNSGESIGWFYDVITELDSAGNGEVIFLAAKLLMRMMGTEHVSIYTAGQRDYCRLAASTSSRAAELGKSIYMPRYPELFAPLAEKNFFFNQEIVSTLPSMASSLAGPDNENRLFIFLWDMPFDKKTLQYSNILKVVGTMIYNAAVRSARYLDALAYKRFIPDTQILQREAFEEMVGVYQRVSDMGLTQYCLLKIKVQKKKDKDKKPDLGKWNEKLSHYLRQTDLMGMMGKRKLGVLLPNSTQEEGKIVMARLAAAGIHSEVYELTIEEE